MVSADDSAEKLVEMKYFVPILKDLICVSYVFGGYLYVLYEILRGEGSNKILLTLLFCHTVTLSNYLHHELVHRNLFHRNVLLNNIIGYLMSWINGGCYFEFHELRQMHLYHHAKKVDYDTLSPSDFLKMAPFWLRKIVIAAEYIYIPAFNLVLWCRAVSSPWWDRDRHTKQIRTLLILAVRGTFFSYLLSKSTFGFGIYVIASSVAVQICRFTDCYSHTYANVPMKTRGKVSTKAASKLEDALRTWSVVFVDNTNTNVFWRIAQNVFSLVIFLNFNYHNAHHMNPNVPWHELPEYDFKIPEITESLTKTDCQIETISSRLPFKFKRNQNEEEPLDGVVSVNRFINQDKGMKLMILNKYHISLSKAILNFHRDRLNRLFCQSAGEPIYRLQKGYFTVDINEFIGVADASMTILEV